MAHLPVSNRLLEKAAGVNLDAVARGSRCAVAGAGTTIVLVNGLRYLRHGVAGVVVVAAVGEDGDDVIGGGGGARGCKNPYQGG